MLIPLYRKITALLSILTLTVTLNAQVFPTIEIESTESTPLDLGKMWTIDYPPVDYFQERYDFTPTEEWLEHVQLSVLKFGKGCTGSFVSSNGLIMTNHHCADGTKKTTALEGEDWVEDGFYAETLEDERKVEGLTVRQLQFIEDVTDEVKAAIAEGVTDDQKVELKAKKEQELIEKYAKETGLVCQVVSFYNGGKYSVQGFKVYDDIRMVFIPEDQAGYFGGDYDNFTYPRYNLDCSFLRAYDENGEPANTENYLGWNYETFPAEDELLFVTGHPGSTTRLQTMSQLEFLRNYTIKYYYNYFAKVHQYAEELKERYPEHLKELQDIKVAAGNGNKVYGVYYKTLQNEDIMKRKRDFEEKIKKAVMENEDYKAKYGHIWDAVADLRAEYADIQGEYYGFTTFSRSPKLLLMAKEVVKAAEELKKPEEERSEEFKGENLDAAIAKITETEINPAIERAKLGMQADLMTMALGDDHPLVVTILKNKKGLEAADYLYENTILLDKENIAEMLKENPGEILNSDDPFIKIIINTADKYAELKKRVNEIYDAEEVLQGQLSSVVFEVYGDNITPDANFSLRVGDGLLKTFEYNGTLAPTFTTFYGMYDRYYSYNGEYPWSLHQRWLDAKGKYDMSLPFNFVSTHDITGGSSGSPVINTNGDVVGLAFDGNINSITGKVIYLPEINRMVSVSAVGMTEALDKVYGAKRLVSELKEGKITP